MFGFGSILASVWAGLQEVLTGGIVEWLTALLGGLFPGA
jgi:hypothetical protein